MQKRSHGFVGGFGFDLLRRPDLAQHAIDDHCNAVA